MGEYPSASVGIKSLAVCSDGTTYPNINKTKAVRRLKKSQRLLQRSISRKYEVNNKKGAGYSKTRNIIKSKKKLLRLPHQADALKQEWDIRATAFYKFSVTVVMAVRETLNKIEELVAKAPRLPLTSKSIISEEYLIRLVEELRKELPQELEHATEVMKERETIIKNAQAEADNIIKQAKLEAEQLVNENDIVIKARDKSRMVLNQAQQQEAEIMERTRQNSKQLQDDADRYANQVFDQLIAHVTNTFQGFQQAQAGLEHARQILQQAKISMNQQAAQQAYTQSYGQGNYNQAYDPNQQYAQPQYDQGQQYTQPQYPQQEQR